MTFPESYARWRATVPFTDVEIADQLDKDAEAFERSHGSDYFRAKYLRFRATRARLGFVSAADVRQTIDALVRACWCGKKALYRDGPNGFCSREHAHGRRKFYDQIRARIDILGGQLEKDKKVADKRALGHPVIRRRQKP